MSARMSKKTVYFLFCFVFLLSHVDHSRRGDTRQRGEGRGRQRERRVRDLFCEGTQGHKTMEKKNTHQYQEL